jgi:hypothetical protein
MQNTCRISKRTRLAIFIALFSPLVSHACSVFYPSVQVGKAFRVRVTDRGRPVPALRLVLDQDDSPQLGQNNAIISLTDEGGYAQFSGLSPGSYLLRPDHDGHWSNAVVIIVSGSGPTNVTVKLTWPGGKVLTAQSLNGTLRGPDFYPEQTQVPLSLSLLEGASGRVIGSAETDPKGAFRFAGAIPAGIYFLRLNPSGLLGWDGKQMEGMIPVEVNSKAEQPDLNIDVNWSSCGLGYAQRIEYPTLQMNKVCGSITDTIRVGIPDAQVALMTNDENATVVEQTKSGARGQFALSEQNGGTYQLLIKYPGFQPFLRVVQLSPDGMSKGCRKPIRVRLDVEN